MSTNTTTTKNYTCVLQAYRFDISKPAERAAYDLMKASLTAKGYEKFESHGGGKTHHDTGRALDGMTLTIETKHVFDNQWNTGPVNGSNEYRVFDWAEDYMPYGTNQNIRKGYWLDLSPDLLDERANRVACGYCGDQYDKRDNPPQFCTKCLSSQYLKREDIHLLRIAPVGLKTNRTSLSEDERAVLWPLYKSAQTKGSTDRDIKACADYGKRLEADYKKKRAELDATYQGKKHLFDAGCPMRILNNVIHYTHTNTWTFGWSKPIEDGFDFDWILGHASEFPFDYNIVHAVRGKIGGKE